MDKCVFDCGTHKNGCNALIEKVCEQGLCPFYKSNKEYGLDENGYVYKKGDK